MQQQRHRKITVLLDWEENASGHKMGITSSAFLPSQQTLITCGRDTFVRLWQKEKCIKSLTHHSDCVSDVCVLEERANYPAVPRTSHRPTSANLFSSPGVVRSADTAPKSVALFVSCSHDGSVLLHKNDETFANVRHTDAVKKVCASPGKTSVFSCSLDHCVMCHDVAGGLRTVTSHECEGELYSLSVFSENTTFAGDAMGRLYAIDARVPCPPRTVLAPTVREAHKDCIRDILPFSDCEILTASSDKTVKLWDTRAMRYAMQCTLHGESVWSLERIKQTSTVLSAGRDGRIVATNFSLGSTALLVQCAYPIFHLNLANGILFCSTSSSSLFGYNLSDLVSADMYNAGKDDLNNSAVSPSRIALETTLTAEVTALCTSEPKKYFASHSLDIPKRPKDQERYWCTSMQRNPGTPSPDVVLSGVRAVIECILLQEKQHILCHYDDNTYAVWSLTKQKCIQMLPKEWSAKKMYEVLKRVEVNMYVASWCVVECLWGCIGVHLSAEETFKAQVSRWMLDYGGYQPSQIEMAPDAGRPISLFTIPRSEREQLREAPQTNIGGVFVKSVFVCPTEQHSGKYIAVWSVGKQSDVAVRRLEVPSPDQLEADVRVPSWIVAFLQNQASLANRSQATTTVTIKCVAFDKTLPALKKNAMMTVNRNVSLAAVAAHISENIGTRLPTLKEVNDGIRSRNGRPINSEERFEATKALPEEFIELLAFDEKTVMEPMMLVGTAYILYREKGSRFLLVNYRRIKPPPQ